MIRDPAPEVPTLNVDVIVGDAYQKWLNDYTTVRCTMRAAMNYEFNYKFDNAQSKEMLQMLNKFFGTLENLSSTEHRSSEREKTNMVQ